jgi:protein-tyrosine phosphatase
MTDDDPREQELNELAESHAEIRGLLWEWQEWATDMLQHYHIQVEHHLSDDAKLRRQLSDLIKILDRTGNECMRGD